MPQLGADQHQDGIASRKGADHTGSPSDLPVQSFNDVVGVDLRLYER